MERKVIVCPYCHAQATLYDDEIDRAWHWCIGSLMEGIEYRHYAKCGLCGKISVDVFGGLVFHEHGLDHYLVVMEKRERKSRKEASHE